MASLLTAAALRAVRPTRPRADAYGCRDCLPRSISPAMMLGLSRLTFISVCIVLPLFPLSLQAESIARIVDETIAAAKPSMDQTVCEEWFPKLGDSAEPGAMIPRSGKPDAHDETAQLAVFVSCPGACRNTPHCQADAARPKRRPLDLTKPAPTFMPPC